YEAEVECYIRHKKLRRESLTPDRSLVAYRRALAKPRNAGLTLDEIGLLGVSSPYSPDRLRERQAALKDFRAPLTTAALTQFARLPDSLRGLVDYCREGTRTFGTYGIPNLLQGKHRVWRFSCDMLLDYNFVGRGCTTEDKRVLQEQDEIIRSVTDLAVAAIENEDEQLMLQLLDKLVQLEPKTAGKMGAYIIRETAPKKDDFVRRAFLNSIHRLPYFSIVVQLEKEYRQASTKDREWLDVVLKNVTRVEPLYPALTRDKWLREVHAIRNQRIAETHDDTFEELGVFGGENLVRKVDIGLCSELEVAWDARWKQEQLPQQ
ncbi:MAG: hypothetical protein KDD44_13015, partial [Bdellovibrionales bacterium]|nr:hypothetical protein [Bdellovibrionales bacterium]